MDIQFQNLEYLLSETEHRYGKRVHILSDPFLLSHLAQLCAESTTQPVINELVTTIYSSLLKIVVNREFPRKQVAMRTRMAQSHPKEGIYQGPVIDPEVPVVTVNLARAGTLPSHICYTALNYFMNPSKVRQDHISIGRMTDHAEQVTGSRVSGHKIGGGVAGGIVLFPDPMGATGGTLVEAVNLYKKMDPNPARKYVALHCIVTPEYLKRVTTAHPDLEIYAVRLDRGLSDAETLKSIPGTFWDREKGLNDKQYIVPGGGGFGEILNNAYV
ncbi:MAG: uracil phosphoribosyltransferase [Bdellovibrionales bacterium]|nr:uracil phosphoribosyltransferase [Bdellovibrionales bacterium]